ncbi:hypothetical protein [Streptomyces sp. NPDC012746]|uniref:hypothetical protein n=1 Tax=Streptomyces sp. NPDC012746 TaxID=3364845 RepID=UPI0036C37A14
MTLEDLSSDLNRLTLPEYSPGQVVKVGDETLTVETEGMSRLALYLQQLHYMLRHPETPKRIAESDRNALAAAQRTAMDWIGNNRNSATSEEALSCLKTLRETCDPILAKYGIKFG